MRYGNHHNRPNEMNNTRKAKVESLWGKSMKLCDQNGGAIEIDEGYLLVNRNKYDVILKKPKR